MRWILSIGVILAALVAIGSGAACQGLCSVAASEPHTRHGIKMIGMPGFGETHEDPELWSIVAAVRRLPALDPAAYRAATEPAGAQGAHAHSHHHHGHP